MNIGLIDVDSHNFPNLALINSLIETGSWIDFEGGLDIRFLTDKGASQLNDMKVKYIHFAWDNYEFKTYEKLKKFRPMIKYDHRKVMVYVLTNFNTTHEQDLERVYKLRELDYDPFVMIYDKPNAPRQTRLLQRWVNNKWVFWKVDRFEDYDTTIA